MKVFHRTYERSSILVLNTRKFSSNTRNEEEGFNRETTRILKIRSKKYYWQCFSSTEGEGMKVFHRTYERSPILVLNTRKFSSNTRNQEESFDRETTHFSKFAREDVVFLQLEQKGRGRKFLKESAYLDAVSSCPRTG